MKTNAGCLIKVIPKRQPPNSEKKKYKTLALDAGTAYEYGKANEQMILNFL